MGIDYGALHWRIRRELFPHTRVAHPAQMPGLIRARITNAQLIVGKPAVKWKRKQLQTATAKPTATPSKKKKTKPPKPKPEYQRALVLNWLQEGQPDSRAIKEIILLGPPGSPDWQAALDRVRTLFHLCDKEFNLHTFLPVHLLGMEATFSLKRVEHPSYPGRLIPTVDRYLYALTIRAPKVVSSAWAGRERRA